MALLTSTLWKLIVSNLIKALWAPPEKQSVESKHLFSIRFVSFPHLPTIPLFDRSPFTLFRCTFSSAPLVGPITFINASRWAVNASVFTKVIANTGVVIGLCCAQLHSVCLVAGKLSSASRPRRERSIETDGKVRESRCFKKKKIALSAEKR